MKELNQGSISIVSGFLMFAGGIEIEHLVKNGLISNIRSSHSHMFFKIGFLKNFTIFTGKHPWLSKKDSNTGVFL